VWARPVWGVAKRIFFKSIEIYKRNKIMKKYPNIFLKMWVWLYWAVLGR